MKPLLTLATLFILCISAGFSQDTLTQEILKSGNTEGKWKYYETANGTVISVGQRVMLGEVDGEEYEFIQTHINNRVADVLTTEAGKILVIERFNINTKNGESYVTLSAIDQKSRQLYIIRYERASEGGEVVDPKTAKADDGKKKKKKKKKKKR